MELIKKIKNYDIYLCSQSPRRQNLLRELGIDFIVASNLPVDEIYPIDIDLIDVPIYIARKKADSYSKILDKKRIIITADTIVICNNEILEKPKDTSEAYKMLKTLSGCMHSVISGVCIQSLERRHCFSSVTKVWFKELTDEEINYYITHYKPLDKAGAYGIQEWIGMIGIKKIEGSYFNVVGLPIQELYCELKRVIDIE